MEIKAASNVVTENTDVKDKYEEVKEKIIENLENEEEKSKGKEEETEKIENENEEENEEEKSEGKEEETEKIENENEEENEEEKSKGKEEETEKIENENEEENEEEKSKGKEEETEKIENENEEENSEVKENEKRTPSVSTIQRPRRERKAITRFDDESPEQDIFKQYFIIEQGRGVALKSIPNVNYKISKSRSEEIFKLLHSVMYNRRAKAAQLKNNILQFSGFVWFFDEAKQRSKSKEKLERSLKEKLVELCELLDIPISKSSATKDAIIAKLLEFLEAPHATTNVLLSEKEKEKKRIRGGGKKGVGSTSGSTSADDASVTRPQVQVEVVENNDIEDRSESQESKEKKKEEENKKNEEVKTKESSELVKKKSKNNGQEGTSKQKKKSEKKKKKDEGSMKDKKKRSRENDDTGKSAPKKHKKGTTESSAKGKEKKEPEKLTPSDEDLSSSIRDMLKIVDFEKATFTDIVKLLADRYNVDLSSRKGAIKFLIQDEITKLAYDGDEQDESCSRADEQEKEVEVGDG